MHEERRRSVPGDGTDLLRGAMTMAASPTPIAPPLVAPERKIRVLVVDDSVVMRRLIIRMLNSDPIFDVVGFARDGLDAIEKVEQLMPEVVTLDVEMPQLDGLGALKVLQDRYPDMKVVMCSSLTERGANTTIDALMAGASDYVTKQHSNELSNDAYEVLQKDLTAKIRRLFGVEKLPVEPAPLKPLAPLFSPGNTGQALGAGSPASLFLAGPVPARRRLAPEVLAIGVSTGGPTALAEMLPMIPADFALPIVIVQHMPPLFTQLLADRLSKLCAMPVMEAAAGMEIVPGRMLIAPGNFHMRLVRKGLRIEVELNQDQPENSCRPAVDVLLRSVAEVYGATTLAVILTGMGQDGLAGIRPLKQLGAPVLVQDKATSAVWGMPGAVAEAKLADAVLPLREIVPEIMRRL